MSSTELRDAYKWIDHALKYDSNNQFQEAYAAYLKTTTFITTVLGEFTILFTACGYFYSHYYYIYFKLPNMMM